MSIFCIACTVTFYISAVLYNIVLCFRQNHKYPLSDRSIISIILGGAKNFGGGELSPSILNTHNPEPP